MCIQPMGCMWLYDNWAKGKNEPKKSKRWVFLVGWSVFLIVIGTFLMVAGTYGSIKGIMDAYNESEGSSAFSCKDNSNSV